MMLVRACGPVDVSRPLLLVPSQPFPSRLSVPLSSSLRCAISRGVARDPPGVSPIRLTTRCQANAEAPASAAPSAGFRPGERKGFVEEMRIRAMKLHTKSQAKEGEQEDKEKPMGKWEPSKQGYIQFLVDSRLVYETMEGIMKEAADPSYKEFLNTGLERTEALDKDLAWFQGQGFSLPKPGKAGVEYSEYLKGLAVSDPPAFVCHFYNVYFAHTAGGRMIGRKVSEMILDNAELEFYKWEGDLQELLTGVREKLNSVAEGWTRGEKDHCLDETMKSFKYSGNIMRVLMS